MQDEVYNRQNCRIWVTEKLEHTQVKPLHPIKVTVWCAITGDVIIGPAFFDHTVNTERYNIMLKEFFFRKIHETQKYAD